jgi:hypothetical protein
MSGPQRSGGLDDLFRAAGNRSGEHRALIVLGVAGLALALILAAFFVGRGFAQSSDLAEDEVAPPPQGSQGKDLAEAALGTRLGPGGEPVQNPARPAQQTGSTAQTAPNGRLLGTPWRGAVVPAGVQGARASCRSEPSVDAGGNRVAYPANHMLDSDPGTAWRCDGPGRGVTLAFNLAQRRTVAAVGLVPGYAKTDAFSGVDRYAENRRITRVRWTFDGGAWVEQTLDTAASNRSLQMLRVPPVPSKRVTLTIEDSAEGRRNTVAVSTVRLAGPSQ